MKKRSILEELNSVHVSRDSDHLIDTTANNIIESSINLVNRIHELYDEDTAKSLENRFVTSIRTGDPEKFRRSLQRANRGK